MLAQNTASNVTLKGVFCVTSKHNGNWLPFDSVAETSCVCVDAQPLSRERVIRMIAVLQFFIVTPLFDVTSVPLKVPLCHSEPADGFLEGLVLPRTALNLYMVCCLVFTYGRESESSTITVFCLVTGFEMVVNANRHHIAYVLTFYVWLMNVSRFSQIYHVYSVECLT